MPTSLLDHALGVRGYHHVKPDYSQGEGGFAEGQAH